MLFRAGISSPVNLLTANIQLQTTTFEEVFDARPYIDQNQLGINAQLVWHHKKSGITQERWQDKDASYRLAVEDSLNRVFYTPYAPVYLMTSLLSRERMYFGVAKFALAEPLYSFYWENLMERIPDIIENDRVRLRFVGHACAIGSDQINLDLSRRRSRLFHERFKEDVKARFPELYEEILGKLDEPEGFGENMPFTILTVTGEQILLGNNELPTARQLNRRVMVIIYEYRL
jgi:outer membrane protein OmpA-like peptidoglycan-associated protein